jgi:hypothetical protein
VCIAGSVHSDEKRHLNVPRPARPRGAAALYYAAFSLRETVIERAAKDGSRLR